MPEEWPPQMQRALVDRVADELGLYFEPGRWRDLRRGIATAAPSLGLHDTDLARSIVEGVATQDEWAGLAGALAVGETYFFRDTGFFGHLASDVLPALVESRRNTSRSLRIWSVGCSSGEEPYSIAMLLASLLPAWREWDIGILATDLRAEALAKARAGVYGAWSLRGGFPAGARAFLRRTGEGRHEVDGTVRGMVRFERLNLARDAYPSASTGTLSIDLIVCRNVLMYFRADDARTIAERLARCLAEGGWLLTNAIEVPAGGMPDLQAVRAPQATAYRRIVSAPAALVEAESSNRGVEPLAVAPRAAARAVAAAPSRSTPPRNEAPTPSDSQDLAGRARALADTGELAAAASACRAAIQKDKLNPEWTYLLASILQECNAFAEAEAALRRTLYLEPGHVLGRIAMANLMIRQGGTNRARQHFAVALDRLSRVAADEVLPCGGGITARELADAVRGYQERVA